MEQDEERPPLAAPPAGPRRFWPSKRALGQRLALLWAVKLLTLATLLVLGLSLATPDPMLESVQWGLIAALAGGSLWFKGGAYFDPAKQRQVFLHEQALEINRGGYRRFVVFESLKHIKAYQGSDDRMQALELHTADDTVWLRDLEGLGEIFVALSAGKPAGVLVEVEERRVDWGEPLPWGLGLGFAVVALIGLAWAYLTS